MAQLLRKQTLNRILIFLFFLIYLSGIPVIYAQNLLEQKSKTLTIRSQKFIQVDGFIEVPENHKTPGLEKIKLPVRIIKSNNNVSREPVFYLDGGPGYSNLGTTDNTALLEKHDLVFVGYRGADGSKILSTRKLYKSFKGQNNQLLSDASLDAMVVNMKTYFNKLESDGIDINRYTIIDVIEDIEAVRKLLNYPQINLLSFSYGTRIALLYTYKYPQAIKRNVMVGVNPPGYFLWYPEKTEEILTLWDNEFKKQGRGSLKEAMNKALDNMPKRWLAYRLDADKIKTTTFLSMSNADMAVMVFDAYVRAANKDDYSGLYATQLLYDVFMKKVIWGDMYAKGASADLQPDVNYRQMLRPSEATTILGPNMSLVLWGSIAAWDNELLPEEYRKPRISETATLVLSGNLDTATPADFAKDKLMPYLPNGRQVILDNFSHADLLTVQPDNFNVFINTFFESGTVDETVFAPQVINLNPKKKLNRLATWGFPILMVMGWLH